MCACAIKENWHGAKLQFEGAAELEAGMVEFKCEAKSDKDLAFCSSCSFCTSSCCWIKSSSKSSCSSCSLSSSSSMTVVSGTCSTKSGNSCSWGISENEIAVGEMLALIRFPPWQTSCQTASGSFRQIFPISSTQQVEKDTTISEATKLVSSFFTSSPTLLRQGTPLIESRLPDRSPHEAHSHKSLLWEMLWW